MISVQNGLKSRPAFAHLHMQLDKAALYLAVGRSHNIKNTPGKPGVFYVGSLANMLMSGALIHFKTARMSKLIQVRSKVHSLYYTK